MAYFDLIETVSGTREPTWAEIKEYAFNYQSVEIVQVGSVFQIRGWMNPRDDRDAHGVAPNEEGAKPDALYQCGSVLQPTSTEAINTPAAAGKPITSKKSAKKKVAKKPIPKSAPRKKSAKKKKAKTTKKTG